MVRGSVTTRILGWAFDQVMHQPLKKFRTAIGKPFVAQEERLRFILRHNAHTEFGKQHGFAAMLGLSATEMWKVYRRNVPLRSYQDFLPYIERIKQGQENILMPGLPEMFSLTSGTTSEPKFCPVNRNFIREHHRQHLLWMYHVYKDHPRINQGKYLVAASPAEMGRTPGGIPYGAMSGKQLDTQSIPVRRRMAVPGLIQCLTDPEERWFNLLLFSLAEENIRVVTAVNPSTLVAIASRMTRHAERLIDCIQYGYPEKKHAQVTPTERALAAMFRPNVARAGKLREFFRADGVLMPRNVWPNLEMLLTWQGGASSFYLPHVAALWGDTAQRCLGLRASEGTFSIPLHNHSASGVLAVGGHVMEFIPAEIDDPQPFEPTLLAGQLEQGGLYRLVITTSGGFYRYDMGDLVRVTGFNRRTPEVTFERRSGAVLSATGEKITEDQVIGAMEIATASGPLLHGFTVTWEICEGVVRYVLAMECTQEKKPNTQHRAMLAERIRQVLAALDDELMHRNCEYQAKRQDGRIDFPRAVLLESGSYDRWRATLAAEGKPENQIKQPILVSPPAPGRAPMQGCKFFDHMHIVKEF